MKKEERIYLEISRFCYTVEYGKQLDADLSEIFHLIDEDKYKEANELIDIFDKKYFYNNINKNWNLEKNKKKKLKIAKKYFKLSLKFNNLFIEILS